MLQYERRSGLVEGDVSVRTDSPDEEIDSSRGLDLGLVRRALRGQVLGLAVQDVDVIGLDVDFLSQR